MEIYITDSIYNKLPKFDIIAYSMNVVVQNSEAINDDLKSLETRIRQEITLENLLALEGIKDGRESYKILKKDPSHCKLAVESLFRRVIKGNQIYRVNNIVDAGNMLSLLLKRSTALLDYNKIVGNVRIRLGNNNDVYEGIGRGRINVTNIPLYEDEVSPFGSPTSDTLRTCITKDTTKVLLLVICFNETDEISVKKMVEEIFSKYGQYTNMERINVKKV